MTSISSGFQSNEVLFLGTDSFPLNQSVGYDDLETKMAELEKELQERNKCELFIFHLFFALRFAHVL